MKLPNPTRTVACIGAGNVGRAWAIVFARAGWPVTLYDRDPDVVTKHALPMIRRHLDDLSAAGILPDRHEVEARIAATCSLEEAVRHAVHVQESAREDIATKADLFAFLDRHTPSDAIIASSTSAIPGSAFLQEVAGRHRCIIAHPVNPPYLIPLVEICASPWTAPQVITDCMAFMSKVGQSPIRVNREIPGFILNRLQFALVGEALHLVGEGYCSVEDIEKVMTEGLARRWALMGPFEVAHLGATAGYRGFMQGLGGMVRSVTRDAKVNYDWTQALVEAIHGRLSERIPVAAIPECQTRRDRRLMALARFIAEMQASETKISG